MKYSALVVYSVKVLAYSMQTCLHHVNVYLWLFSVQLAYVVFLG